MGTPPIDSAATCCVRRRAGPLRGDDRVALSSEQVLRAAEQRDELLVDGSRGASTGSGVRGHDAPRRIRR